MAASELAYTSHIHGLSGLRLQHVIAGPIDLFLDVAVSERLLNTRIEIFGILLRVSKVELVPTTAKPKLQEVDERSAWRKIERALTVLALEERLNVIRSNYSSDRLQGNSLVRTVCRAALLASCTFEREGARLEIRTRSALPVTVLREH